jgi:hypothetical protein
MEKYVDTVKWFTIHLDYWFYIHLRGTYCRFIVNGGAPGLKISKIDNKMSLRVVQNCDILLEDVFVPDDAVFLAPTLSKT